MLHPVTPRRVDLLRGRRLSALLFQLHNGEAAQNSDRKLIIQIIERQKFVNTHLMEIYPKNWLTNV